MKEETNLVWKTIAFLNLNTDLDLQTLLNNYETDIKEEDNLLKGISRISKINDFREDQKIILGFIIKEYLTKIKKLVRVEAGDVDWRLTVEWVKTTNYAPFWLVTKNCTIFFDSTFDRYHSIRVLRNALDDPRLDCPIINITNLASNYNNHWLGGFIERQSNINSGMLFGENIKADPEIGEAYSVTTKNQLGIRERVGGRRMKIKITSNGYIQFFRNVTNEEIYDFLNRCVIDYIIN